MAKAITKDEQLFRTIRDGRWYRASTLVKRVSHRFGAYIFSLRAIGCEIESVRDPKTGEWRYRLVRVPFGLTPGYMAVAA